MQAQTRTRLNRAHSFAPGSRVKLGCLALCLGALLSGCNESLPSAQIETAAPQQRASGLSPRPAALAVTQMEGAPQPLQNQFMALFNADVVKEDVTLTDTASARYLARGYISAFPVDGGARLTYVWDVYDRTNHRAQRLNDEIALTGAAPDPWSLVDTAALAALATRSAGEVAAFLSNTPEAVAAAPAAAPQQAIAAHIEPSLSESPVAPAPGQAAPMPSQALSYAGTR